MEVELDPVRFSPWSGREGKVLWTSCRVDDVVDVDAVEGKLGEGDEVLKAK